MIEFIRTWATTQKARWQSELNSIQVEDKLVAEAGNVVTEKQTDGGWEFIRSNQKDLVMTDQLRMIQSVRRLFRYDPNARAAIFNMVKYVIGRGVIITPKFEDKKVWHVWRTFWTDKKNKMGTRQFEMVLRFFRDGEMLMQFFNKDSENKATWKTLVRFRDPDDLRTPPMEYKGDPQFAKNGVEVDPNDVETVLRYWFQDPYFPNIYTKVDANDVLHVKCMADSDQKRGETFILPVMNLIGQYTDWLQNRLVLNRIRTAIAFVRKIKGGSADVNRIAGSLGTSSRTAEGENKSNNIRRGTILNANEAVDYEFKTPNINAADVKDDGRAVITRIAGGTGQPEHNFGDASNANYASTFVAEAPFVKEIQYFQAFLEEAMFKPLYRRVIENAVEAKALKEPAEKDPMADDELQEAEKPPVKPGANGNGNKPADDDAEGEGDENPKEKKQAFEYQETEKEKFYGCDIQWPEIIHRDLKELTDSLTIQRSNGWVSDKTASETLGFEFTEEWRKQQSVRDMGDSPFDNGGVIDPEALAGEEQLDNEARQQMASLTKEQRAQVMAEKDPEKVAKLLSKFAAATAAN